MSTTEQDQAKAIGEALLQYDVASEGLTRMQLAEAVRQAIACGDFVRLTHLRSGSMTDPEPPHRSMEFQTVVYSPFRGHRGLERQIAEAKAAAAAQQQRAEEFRDEVGNQKNQIEDLTLQLQHAIRWFDQLNEHDVERYQSTLDSWKEKPVVVNVTNVEAFKKSWNEAVSGATDLHQAVTSLGHAMRAADVLASGASCNVEGVLKTLADAGLVIVESTTTAPA